MDGAIAILVVVAGFVGGIVTAVAGGSGLITFPALMFAGLSPLSANASNAVALSASNFAAAWADRESWPRLDAAFWRLIGACALGTLIGCALLLATGERAFTALVPALLMIATGLYAAAPAIVRWADTADRVSTGTETGTATIFGLICIYGGYFGSGLGVLMLAVLRVAGLEDARRANALKNLGATAIGAVTVPFFTATALVSWPETALMFTANVVGGYVGGLLGRVLPGAIVRRVVLATGAVLSAVFAWRLWF